MAKEPPKLTKTHSNTINSVLTENKTTPKSRQQIYQENYQKNKERKKQQRRERYQQDKAKIKTQQKEKYYRKKELAQQQEKEQLSKYYGAEAIKVLMSFKEYTELNKEKKKLWLDFNWTMKDCQELIKKGFGNVVVIMKLAQVADNLIRDFWDTAKKEVGKGKSWNSLTDEEQQRLIRYWGYEKIRIENGYIDEKERLEKQSQTYLKEIELAKFHEERGKVKCPCYACEEKKTIQKEAKVKIDKELKEQGTDNEKGKCNECGKIRVLDEETGACKKCSESYKN